MKVACHIRFVSVSLSCHSFYDITDYQGVICDTPVATRTNTDIKVITIHSCPSSRSVIPALRAEVFIPFGVCACRFVFELPFIIAGRKEMIFKIFHSLLFRNTDFA